MKNHLTFISLAAAIAFSLPAFAATTIHPVTFSPEAAAPGETVKATFHFEADGPYQHHNAVFVHIMDENGKRVGGQAQWLSEINDSFRAFADSWVKYFEELFYIWGRWAHIEQSQIATVLLSELKQAKTAYTAQRNILMKGNEVPGEIFYFSYGIKSCNFWCLPEI